MNKKQNHKKPSLATTNPQPYELPGHELLQQEHLHSSERVRQGLNGLAVKSTGKLTAPTNVDGKQQMERLQHSP